MKKVCFLLLISLLLSNGVLAQRTSEWLRALEDGSARSSRAMKPENLLRRYLNHDLSDLLIPKTDFLGYIGSEYRRIDVEFHSIRKNENIPNQYLVSGRSTVFSNTCDFEGTITLEQFREFETMNFGVDDMYENTGFLAQGIAIGKYHFSENAAQSHVGIFEGIMTIWWYIDKSGQIQYDMINPHSDSYVNNQYVGIWSEYGKETSRPCNWGERRIPYSGDLDIGAGDFYPNPKYDEKGWQGFRN